MSRIARYLVPLLAAVVLATVAVPAAAPAAPLLGLQPPIAQARPCEGNGQYFTTECPTGTKVAEAPNWNEGYSLQIPQYWTGTFDWGWRINVTTEACPAHTNHWQWGIVPVVSGPNSYSVTDTPHISSNSNSGSFKLVPSPPNDYGYRYVRIHAACFNGTNKVADLMPTIILFRAYHVGPPPSGGDPPTATCTATQTGDPGNYHFVADADDPENGALSYEWDFGDGSPNEAGDNRTHQYAKPGEFAASVKVTDIGGQSVVAACPVDVPAPDLGLAIVLPDKEDGNVLFDETFKAQLIVSAGADGVGALSDLEFAGDPLRLSPQANLEITSGPEPEIPETLEIQPGESITFDYDVHVLSRGLATLASRIAGKDAAGREVDSDEVTRRVSAPSLLVTITPSKTNFKLDADAEGKPEPEEITVDVAVKNVTTEPVGNVTVAQLELAAFDPNRTYDPFPAEIFGENGEVVVGTLAAGETTHVTRHVRVLGDGHMKLLTLVTSDGSPALGEEELRTDVQTLLRMTIDGDTTRLATAGSPVTFFGRFTNVTNERTVAITDPMKVIREGNLLGGGLIAEVTTDGFPRPLIGKLDPGKDVEFSITFNTDRPTIDDYDAGNDQAAAWTSGAVDFNVWVRAAVKEDDDSWAALSADDPCICDYPESVVIEGGSLGRFDVVIDTTERVIDSGQFGSAAFGFSLGALQGAQRRLSGIGSFIANTGRFVLIPDYREEVGATLLQGRLKDSLDYLAEIAVWLPAAEVEEVAETVGDNLSDAYAGFTETVTSGIPHPEDTRTAQAITAVAREYIEHLQGAWRRGDPNELIDAVMPAGGFVGEQVTDVIIGEAVFEALAHMATVPTYLDLAAQNWRDARTIAQMQDKLPSLANQSDLLDAIERSKSNFQHLEDAYQARRPLVDAELGGADNGAGLGRDTIQTARRWSADNPNQVIVVLPNEPASAALRDAGLAVGKIENIKPKSMASIEYLVFGGRAQDRNAVILRDLRAMTEAEVNTRVDALIAAGELAEEDRAVAIQILATRNKEWKLFSDRGVKDPDTGVVTPDASGIGLLKTYDEARHIPNQFRGEDNGVLFSGPKQHLEFKLEYYKGDELLPPGRIGEADYVVLLQEHPVSGELVKIVGDDDGLFMGMINGLGLAPDRLEAAYASVWHAFNHPFSDTWLAHVSGAVKAKLKIFSRYFTNLPDTGEAGKPLVAFVNGEAFAVKIDPWLSRIDPTANRAFIKYVGLPQAVDPVNPGGWINAVLRSVRKLPLPALYLRSLLHLPGGSEADLPPINGARNARVLRLNESGRVESWTPTTGWLIDPVAEAEIAATGAITVAPQTQVYGSVEPGAVRIEIAPQSEMALVGDWFEIGDTVVLDPGGPNEETATINDFGSLVFSAPLQHAHQAGELISFLSAADVEPTGTPRQLKQAALAALRAMLPTGGNRADRRISRAISRLEASLRDERWLDEVALVPSLGTKVFRAERRAVRLLDRPSLRGRTEIVQVIADLLAADRGIARYAIDASSDTGAQAAAEGWMTSAEAHVGAGRSGKAIRAYMKAWKLVR